MRFKRITRLEIDGLIILDCSQLERFVRALEGIEVKPYHDNTETDEDFECIRRNVVYQMLNRLKVEQFDSRNPQSRLVYSVEF